MEGFLTELTLRFVEEVEMTTSPTLASLRLCGRNNLKDFHPDMIFVPSIFENHPDHIESAVIIANALRKYEGHPTCYCYEV
ncbi:MAG: hypothetical protein ACXW4Z_20175, partial [Candidatus Binatia bacterium]